MIAPSQSHVTSGETISRKVAGPRVGHEPLRELADREVAQLEQDVERLRACRRRLLERRVQRLLQARVALA